MAVKNGSDRLLGSQVAEQKALWTWNATSGNAVFSRCYGKFQCLRILSCYLKLTRILVKKELESRQKQLGKAAVVKAGGLTLCLWTERYRSYEVKIEESEKAGSHWKLNPGHLWLVQPVLCH